MAGPRVAACSLATNLASPRALQATGPTGGNAIGEIVERLYDFTALHAHVMRSRRSPPRSRKMRGGRIARCRSSTDVRPSRHFALCRDPRLLGSCRGHVVAHPPAHAHALGRRPGAVAGAHAVVVLRARGRLVDRAAAARGAASRRRRSTARRGARGAVARAALVRGRRRRRPPRGDDPLLEAHGSALEDGRHARRATGADHRRPVRSACATRSTATRSC